MKADTLRQERMSHVSETSKKPGKLTLCITELDVGGAEKALVRIAIGLKNLGWEIDVVSVRDRGPLAQKLEEADIPVAALHCRGLLDVRAIFRLTRHLKKCRSTILMCFLHQANLAGRFAARLTGVKVCISGIRVADRRWQVVWTDRLTRWLVDHYVAVSQNVADEHSRLCRISSKKITAISNGVEIDLPKPSHESSNENRNRILFVGRLTPQKAPIDLLDAYQRLPQDLRQTTQLTFVGEGPQRSLLEARIQELDLQGHVELVGQSDDVPKFLATADLFVLPSKWEGLPNAALRGNGCGCSGDINVCRWSEGPDPAQKNWMVG